MRKLTHIAACLFGLVTACTSVPITSLPRLSTLDPIVMDPAQLDVAVRLQEGLALGEEGVTLSFRMLNKTLGEEVGGEFPLQPLDEPLNPFLLRQQAKGGTVLRFRLDEDQSAMVRQARDQMLLWQENPDSEGVINIAVTAEPCLLPGVNPFRTLRFSVYLREAPDRGYFTVLSNARFKVTETFGRIDRCGETTPEAPEAIEPTP